MAIAERTMPVTILSGRLEAEGDEPHEQASDDEEQSALEMARTALREAAAAMGPGSGDFVCPGDPIHVLHDDGFLRYVGGAGITGHRLPTSHSHTQRRSPMSSSARHLSAPLHKSAAAFPAPLCAHQGETLETVCELVGRGTLTVQRVLSAECGCGGRRSHAADMARC